MMKYPVNTTDNPVDVVIAMSQDITTLVFELIEDSEAKFSPNTEEVLSRWRPFIEEQFKIFRENAFGKLQ